MKKMKGIDCAIPVKADTAKALAAAGMKFVCRYLVPERLAWKRLTRSEAEAISAVGMKVVSVFETTASRPAGGAAAGKVDGVEAYKEAKLIKQPPGTVIYFAVDYDAQPKDYDNIESYLRAAAAEVHGYKVGVYGSYAVIEAMYKRKACTHFWQTYAWSRGKQSAYANIYQYKNDTRLAGINLTLDLNESFGNEGWWDTKSTEVPKPSQPEEVKPKMKQEDAEKIIRFLSAAWYATDSQEAKAEYNRLADEVRKAAGIIKVG
ncbi:DUF1906 domain-containing protein [Paenibacillus sp. MSJ-34]|uniref:DUF1906 domain-containing protein n=1 Tax=Paenibacillus sp. MSJ-34 TaxID=2841529 RepID=UPI00209E6E1C|nr:glycoside hydrolase domain-containing protein [Paenibacillus sp. MSJ-34]